MKKNWKTWIAGGAALTLLVGTLSLPTLAASGSRIAQLDYADMKVTLNGQTVDLRDAYGNKVEPFTINGTTYLPVASIGKALDLNVSWDNSTKTVILTTASGGQSTGTNSGATNANTGSYIGEAKAKEIALNHAGVSASQATFVRSQFEYDDAGPCMTWISGAGIRSMTMRSTPSPEPLSAMTLTLKGTPPPPPAAPSPALTSVRRKPRPSL